MEKVTDYRILCESDDYKLVESVKYEIDNGRQPIGGVAAAYCGTNGLRFYQALAKYSLE